jgi:hypothetical protein
MVYSKLVGETDDNAVDLGSVPDRIANHMNNVPAALAIDARVKQAEAIAELLPIAHTGGIREATKIVREYLNGIEPPVDRLLFDEVVGALVGRSRNVLSQHTPRKDAA